MRYPASEKLEITRLEEQSHLPSSPPAAIEPRLPIGLDCSASCQWMRHWFERH